MKLLALIIFVSLNYAHAKPNKEYKAVKLTTGLGTAWGIEFVDKDTMITTDKRGKYTVINLVNMNKKRLNFPLEVKTSGQGGLLDIKKHPKFKKNKYLYFTYSKQAGELKTTALARGRWNIKTQEVEDIKDLFIATANTDTSRHFGSRLAFDDKGFLFMSVGDRGHRPNGQSLSTHAGKILRLTDKGKAPKDNPFYNNKNALAEIWSYGHRNPQGLVFDFKRKVLFEMEHGPRGGDEINIIEKAKNYGWATISYGKEYWGPIQVGEGTKKKGMVDPVKYYVPSIAPCGLEVYYGDKFPELNGALISGALKMEHLNIVWVEGSKAKKELRLFEKLEKRFRTVKSDKQGNLYFTTDDGELYKVEKI